MAGITDKMSPKDYAAWDRAFMLFGSLMNQAQGSHFTKSSWDKAWQWAKQSSRDWTEENYQNGDTEQAL